MDKQAAMERAAGLINHAVELGQQADCLEFDAHMVKLAQLIDESGGPDKLLSACSVDKPATHEGGAGMFNGSDVYKHLCEICGDPIKAQAVMHLAIEDGVDSEMNGELDDLYDDDAPNDVLAGILGHVRDEALCRDSLEIGDADHPNVTVKDVNLPAGK